MIVALHRQRFSRTSNRSWRRGHRRARFPMLLARRGLVKRENRELGFFMVVFHLRQGERTISTIGSQRVASGHQAMFGLGNHLQAVRKQPEPQSRAGMAHPFGRHPGFGGRDGGARSGRGVGRGCPAAARPQRRLAVLEGGPANSEWSKPWERLREQPSKNQVDPLEKRWLSCEVVLGGYRSTNGPIAIRTPESKPGERRMQGLTGLFCQYRVGVTTVDGILCTRQQLEVSQRTSGRTSLHSSPAHPRPSGPASRCPSPSFPPGPNQVE